MPHADQQTPTNPLLGRDIEQISDSLPTAVFVFDVEDDGGYRLIALNQLHRDLTGLDDAVGKRLEEFLPPDMAAAVQANYDRCVQCGEQISYREQLALPAGVRWWRTSLSPIRDPGGAIRRLFGSAVDITRQKLAEERLQEANRALDEAIQIIAHDLKQPLRAIRYSVAFALEDHSEGMDPGLRKRVDKVDTLADQGLSLIGSLTVYGRLATEGFCRTEVDTDAIVRKVLSTFAGEIEARRACVEVNPLPQLYGDKMLVERVFANLIANALKYSDGEPEVTVGYTDETAEYWVADRGIGIAPRHHASVFRLFRRLHKPGERGGGDGMGLSLVAKIVHRHGGSVRLTSEPGVGTTVYFHLPFEQ